MEISAAEFCELYAPTLEEFDLICGFREYFEAEEFERLVGIRFNRYLLEDYA